MEKALTGLLRWAVILGLLVALPAFALRDKWQDVKELLLGDETHTAAGTVAAGELDFAKSVPSPVLKPLPPARITEENSRSFAQAESTSSPSQRGRPLRVPVYRPLGNAADQLIRRVRMPGAVSPAGTVDDELAQLEHRVRDLGAQTCRWQFDAASGEYVLVCDFAQANDLAPQQMRTRSAQPIDAMRKMLAEAQAGVRRIR